MWETPRAKWSTPKLTSADHCGRELCSPGRSALGRAVRAHDRNLFLTVMTDTPGPPAAHEKYNLPWPGGRGDGQTQGSNQRMGPRRRE